MKLTINLHAEFCGISRSRKKRAKIRILSNGLSEKIKNGASFEDLARQFSKCPSGKKSGGDLGFFGKGQMVQQFENAASKLKVGEISQPVRSQFGYHIIKKTDEK